MKQYRSWVQESIAEGRNSREDCWTESVAVGSLKFIEDTKTKPGISAKGRRIDEKADFCVLREESEPYNADFAPENEALRVENAYYWANSCVIPAE